MPLFPEAPIRLHVAGRVRRVPLDGMASLAVDADGVLVAPLDGELQAASVVRIPFEVIDGVSVDDEGLFGLRLHLTDGELAGHGDRRAADLASAILARGRTVPELTRAARALGRGRGGREQEAFFRPLLESRRRAVRDWRTALVAFDADAMEGALEQVIASMATVRIADHPAARRALEAQLFDAAEPLLLALVPVRWTAAAALNAEPAQALRAWRAWVHAVHALFDRADAAWVDVQAVLDRPRPARSAPAPRVSLDRLRLPWVR